MMLPLFIAAAIAVAGTDAQQGVFYDMQTGIPAEIETKCEGISFHGVWTEDEAANHQLTEGGKVAVSEKGKESCMRAPFMEFQRDLKFTIRFFVSENEKNKPEEIILLVFFAEEGTTRVRQLIIQRREINAGWNKITKNVPLMDFTKKHQVEITSTKDIEYIAVRWFGISINEELPPTTTTTPAAEPETSVNTTPAAEPETSVDTTPAAEPETSVDTTPAAETSVDTTPTAETSVDTTSEAITTTTAGEDQSTSSPTELITTTTVQAQTELTTTSKEPITETTPKPPVQVVSVFPELWSTLLGIAIGIIAMCLLFFVATCCRWCLFGKRTGRQRIDSGFRLPRLHVVSTSSQKSITGSIGTDSSASTADPFWVKSKAWSHIP